jgi:predicted dienelactone hydrolase
MAQLCSTHPSAPECGFVKPSHGDQLDTIPGKPIWVHDAWFKAAVIAAPAVSLLFGPGDLRQFRVPVQLWRAEDDTQAPIHGTVQLSAKSFRPAEEHMVPGVDHFVFLAPAATHLWQRLQQFAEMRRVLIEQLSTTTSSIGVWLLRHRFEKRSKRVAHVLRGSLGNDQ